MGSATKLACLASGLLIAMPASAQASRTCDAAMFSWVGAAEKHYEGSAYEVSRESVAKFDYIDFWDLGAAILVGVAEQEAGSERFDTTAVLATDKMLACMENDIAGSVDPEELTAMVGHLNEVLPKTRRSELVAQMQAEWR